MDSIAHAVPATPIRRRGLLVALVGLTVVSLGAGAFSLARFTDTDSSTGDFASGTIVINSNPAVVFTVADMLPGDSDTQALEVRNDGSGQFRYAMSTVATGALGAALQLTVRTEGTDCATFDGDPVIGPRSLDGAAIGSAAQGAQAGDRILDGMTRETLCFRVSLPFESDNDLQGLASGVTFQFDAEQVAHNP